MSTVWILLADGFEEIEAVAVIDVLRRAEIEVLTVGIGHNRIASARHLVVETDTILSALPDTLPTMIVLPGGEPGTSNLEKTEAVATLLQKQHDQNGWIAAICAAPRILDHLGFLTNKKATSFPDTKPRMTRCVYIEKNVVISDTIVTSRGAGTALDFAYALVEVLVSPTASETLQKKMVYRQHA